MTQILHIAGDFPNQDLYPRLVGSLAEHPEFEQTVLAAVRSRKEAETAMPPFPRVHYELRHILRPAHRLLFRSKIRLITDTARRLEHFADTDIVHAHSLYSDGAAGLALWRTDGIPYISAVRNVDLHTFMPVRRDLFLIRDAVLRHAAAIVFLSPAYRRVFLARLPHALASSVDAKAYVIPNGVAPRWLQGATIKQSPPPGVLRLLYVGDLSKNKNIRGILGALAILSRTEQVSLTVAGGSLEEARKSGLPLDGQLAVRFVGRVSDPDRLKEIYLDHDVFVMPSFTETFGIAYVEALSQGLPVVHSRDQGIDGYFPGDAVAEPVDPDSHADIARGIMAAAGRLPGIRGRCIEAARMFDWNRIGARYAALYEEARRCRNG